MKSNGCTAGHINQANMKELLDSNVVAVQDGKARKTYELVVQAGHHVKCVDPALRPYFSSRCKSAKHNLCYPSRVNDTNSAKFCISPSTTQTWPNYAFVTDFVEDAQNTWPAKTRGSLTILSTHGRPFTDRDSYWVEHPDEHEEESERKRRRA